MNFADVQQTNIGTDFDDVVFGDDNSALIPQIDQKAIQIDVLAKKQIFSDYLVRGGFFTVGVLAGSLGSSLAIDVVSRVTEIAIPKIVYLVGVLFATASFSLFSLIAIPIVIYISVKSG